MRKRIIALLTLAFLLLGLFPAGSAAADRTKLSFGDVKDGAWYYDAVMLCYANGILNGTSELTFSPGTGTTREQMTVVLAKLSGEDVKGSAPTPFTDVIPNKWYTDYINWAYEKNYTKGISDSLFGVGKELTRQEAVTLIYNYSNANCLTQSDSADLGAFSDSENIADWAKDAFGWAVYNSVIKGDNKAMLNPLASVKRSELAVMISVFIENILHADCEHSYTTVSCDEISVCSGCSLIKRVGKPHKYVITDCTKESACADCSHTLAPKGHTYAKASCTSPMKCTVCKAEYGSALGHTTDNGVCTRCGKEFFADAYSKFSYYMTHSASVKGAVRYLSADVTHPDGNTSKQYIKYDTDTKKTSIEIIFSFAKNDHRVKTTFEFSAFSSVYTAKSEYLTGNKVLCSATANIYSAYLNKDQYIELSSYSGAVEHKALMRTLVKSSVLLSVDSSNKLLSQINMSVKDMGFINFY